MFPPGSVQDSQPPFAALESTLDAATCSASTTLAASRFSPGRRNLVPGSALSPAHRVWSRGRMDRETFDVLVVGGGVTGCGAALDAATRGLSVR